MEAKKKQLFIFCYRVQSALPIKKGFFSGQNTSHRGPVLSFHSTYQVGDAFTTAVSKRKRLKNGGWGQLKKVVESFSCMLAEFVSQLQN